MNYKSPLHILTGKDWEKLNPENLTKWRKELMLRFDLKGATTIFIDGVEYDRNTILEAFETLQREGTFHVKVAQNPELVDFLENGETILFRSDDFLKLFQDQAFKEWISPLFQKQLSEVYYQSVKKPNFHSIKKLKDLKRVSDRIPSSIHSFAIAKTHNHLSKRLAEAQRLYKSPLLKENSKKLKPGIKEYINAPLTNAIKALPEAFSGLQFRYALFAHSLIFALFKEPTHAATLPRETLVTLKAAAELELAFREDKSIAGILRDINAALVDRPTGDGCLTGWSSIFYFIMFLVFIVRLFTTVNSCNRKDYKNDYRLNVPSSYQQMRQPIVSTVEEKDLFGIWEHKKSLDSLTQFKEFYVFYTLNYGYIEQQIIKRKEGDTCKVKVPFWWDIDQRISHRKKLNLNFWDHREESCTIKELSQFDKEKLKTFEELIAKGSYNTTFHYYDPTANLNLKKLDIGVRQYRHNGPGKGFEEDFKGIEKLQLKELEKRNNSVEIEAIFNNYMVYKTTHFKNQFVFYYDYQGDFYGFKFQNSRLFFANDVKDANDIYFTNLTWADYNNNRSLGYLKVVPYIDKDGQKKVGSLDLMFSTQYDAIVVSERLLE